jgi:hypothetical protein
LLSGYANVANYRVVVIITVSADSEMKGATTMKQHAPGVEIVEYNGPSYKPVIQSDADWMAAVMNGWKDSWSMPERIEKHLNSDELFVLLAGTALMITGGSGEEPGKINVLKMKKNLLYNVKKGTWHTTPMKKDGKFLIIERKDTRTRRVPLTPVQKKAIKL